MHTCSGEVKQMPRFTQAIGLVEIDVAKGIVHPSCLRDFSHKQGVGKNICDAGVKGSAAIYRIGDTDVAGCIGTSGSKRISQTLWNKIIIILSFECIYTIIVGKNKKLRIKIS